MSLRDLLAPCAVAVVLSLTASPALGVELAVERHQLSNGLTVLLHEEHAVPVVTFQVFYRCGGRDEVVGATGISHLLEHMMFNGSEHYPPKAFDHLLEAAGGSSNGYTWKDQTAYMETFPPAALDLVLAMESDRMRSLAITPENLEQERGIVAEERRYAVDNDNDGAQWESLLSLMFQAYPYRDPVVGWMDDIEHFTQGDLQAWYDRCYAPANALIVLAGDIESQRALADLEQSFGGLEAGESVVHPRWNEPEQEGLRYAELHRPAGNISISVGYVGPAGDRPELLPLELLDFALSGGRSSMLIDELVHRQGVLLDVSTSLLPLEEASLFLIDAVPADGVSAQEALDAIEAQVASLREQPLDEARLARARRQLELGLYHDLETVEARADMLGSWELFQGGTAALFDRPAQWATLSAEDLRASAERWLTPERRSVVVLFPVDEEGGVE
jgi:zinc protease